MLQLKWKQKEEHLNNAYKNRQVETRHKDLLSIKQSINLQIKQDNEMNEMNLTNQHDLEQKYFEMAFN